MEFLKENKLSAEPLFNGIGDLVGVSIYNETISTIVDNDKAINNVDDLITENEKSIKKHFKVK